MTQNPIRWTRVLFGAGLTLAVAMSPLLYVLLFAPSPDGVTRQASDSQSAMSLMSNGFDLSDHRSTILLIAGVAVTAVLASVAAAARSQHTEASRTQS